MRILVHVCCAPCFTSVHKTLTAQGHDVVGYFFNPNIHPYQEFLNRLHCLERYTALIPVKVIYDRSYNLDKYLVGALDAMYSSPSSSGETKVEHQAKPTNSKVKKDNAAFQEKVHQKESLSIKLTPQDASSVMPVSFNIHDDIKVEETKTTTGTNNDPDKPRCGYCIGLRLSRCAEYAAKKGYDAFTTTLLESKYQPHDHIRSVGFELAIKHGIEFYYEDFRSGWKESIRLSKELELYRQQYCGCIFSEYERFGPE